MLSEEERALFRAAVSDAKPLKRERTAIARPMPSPTPRQKLLDQGRLREEMLHGKLDPADLETGEELNYLRPGIPRLVMRRLRRGQYSVGAELDLHGFTLPRAQQALGDFLRTCRVRGIRCVRIVHGKGLNSPDGVPVIKLKLQHWLRQRREVLAYCSARPVDGGAGALYALLERR
ncbi:MAG TPA: DNA mismatch repair protein MutS [Gammaproteobacteria bacterium]|nr:DNA mismatch repair protein MutS [Gammaproteobacteria bacterium]